MRLLTVLTIVLLFSFVLSPFSAIAAPAAPSGAASFADTPAGDIVEVAQSDARFKTLVAAIQAAGLVDTLKGDGPFTVFAPTDQAFAKLPKATLESLLKPENKDQLANILLYHVSSGALMASEVAGKSSVQMANDLTAIIQVAGRKVTINNATITATDIKTKNGVIHVIDTVILPPADVVDTLVADRRFKTLVAAVQAGGLVDTLKGKGPFTVFAPTDQAFARLPRGTLDTLLKPENKSQLADILKYHVVPGYLPAAEVLKNNTLDTVLGQKAIIDTVANRARINGVTISVTNIPGSNGVVHVIDAVIVPPADVVDTLVADRRFKTLVAAVQAGGLVDTLKGKGPFTIFAPTDQAFARLPRGTLETLLKPENKGQLADILKYHVVSGYLPAADVLKAGTLDTVLGQKAIVDTAANRARINGVTISATNIPGSNGVIHVIDAVIVPPADVVDTLVADRRFKTLVAAVQAGGLVDTLKGKGPFTVFAPTDQAFARLPRGTLDTLLKSENKSQLADILKYHVIPGNLTAANVVQKQLFDTALGKPVKVTTTNNRVMINNAMVTVTNIPASNGVIHVIDTVILPPADIVDTLVADRRFKTLVAAVQAAGLADALKAEGPFTLFAPTDQAFAKLPRGTLETLLKPENQAQLKDILLYHVSEGRLMSGDVVKLQSSNTLLGKSAAIKVEGGKVFFDGATVTITDILTSNGVIHVIDAVALPD